MRGPSPTSLAGLATANVSLYRNRALAREMTEIHAGRTALVLGTLLALVALVWPLVVAMAAVHVVTPKR